MSCILDEQSVTQMAESLGGDPEIIRQQFTLNPGVYYALCQSDDAPPVGVFSVANYEAEALSNAAAWIDSQEKPFELAQESNVRVTSKSVLNYLDQPIYFASPRAVLVSKRVCPMGHQCASAPCSYQQKCQNAADKCPVKLKLKELNEDRNQTATP